MRTPIVVVMSLTALLASMPAAAQTETPSQPQTPSQTQAPVYQQVYQEDEYNNYFTVYLLRNFGGKLFQDADATRGFGLAMTFWARGGASAELDFSSSPDFLGLDKAFGFENKLYTLTLSGVFGPWIHAGNHAIRPYGVVGGGLMRSKFTDFADLGANSSNQGIITFGGGVVFLANRRIGVRGDVRYNKGVGEKADGDGWGFLEDFNYLKGSIGLSIAF